MEGAFFLPHKAQKSQKLTGWVFISMMKNGCSIASGKVVFLARDLGDEHGCLGSDVSHEAR